DGIRQEMPDINIVEDWSLGTAKRKPRRSNHGQALAKFFEVMKPGKQAVSTVKDYLGMSARTFDRLVADLKDHTTELYQKMVSAGVRYEVRRAGRTQRAYFAKA
ncbi:MAG TPA: hypothetical protein VKA48_08545, partial [Gammaproteobacteria bacterium]|nr:hypothetical protein [Gammaproteobacteria bacterium]